MPNLISIDEAAKQGITRLRKPNWAIPQDHMEIAIYDGAPAPWAKLYSPTNLMVNGQDGFPILLIQFDTSVVDMVPYEGPIAGSPEYLAVQNKYPPRVPK